MAEVPVKVLQLLVHLPVGGAENMVAALATSLNPEMFQVQVATIGPPGYIGEELARMGQPVVSLRLDIRRTSAWTLFWAVRGLLQDFKPDILHTHLYHANLYGRLASLGLGLRGVVATVHNIYKRVKLHRCVLNCLMSWVSDYVIVFGPQVRHDVKRYDLVAASRIRMLSPGVPIEDLSVKESLAEAKELLRATGFCIGTVSRLEEQKGQEYLLKAIDLIRPEIPDLTLLIVGDGTRRASLERLVRDLGLKKSVRFLGIRRDVPLILRSLDLYVQPSLWEGIPLTLLEAMGAGVPVISTRVGRASEVIQDGENGRLVPPGDAEAMAAAILGAYRHPEWRSHWKEKGEPTIAEKYSLSRMLNQFANIYLELYQKGASR